MCYCTCALTFCFARSYHDCISSYSLAVLLPRDNLLVHRCVRRLYDSLNTSALKNALRPRNAYVGLPYISSSLIFIFFIYVLCVVSVVTFYNVIELFKIFYSLYIEVYL